MIIEAMLGLGQDENSDYSDMRQIYDQYSDGHHDGLYQYMMTDEPVAVSTSLSDKMNFKYEYLAPMTPIEAPTAMVKQDLQESDHVSAQSSWHSVAPSQWDRKCVVGWLMALSQKYSIEYDDVVVSFQNYSGDLLSRMSKADFERVDPAHGETLFLAMREEVERRKTDYYLNGVVASSAAATPRNFGADYVNKHPVHWDKGNVVSWLMDISPESKYEGIVVVFNSLEGRRLAEMTKYEYVQVDSTFGEFVYEAMQRELRAKQRLVSSDADQIDRYHSPDLSAPKPLRNKPTTSRRNGNCKLWEFIRDILLDPGQSLIKWENRDEGVFKFTRSDEVARMWGARKGNTKMNYEKLSRAMRYHYKSGYLEAVIGKRLVYKFGPHATGWRVNETAGGASSSVGKKTHFSSKI